LKVTTWNVNSIGIRLPVVLSWLKKNAPDILLLQELKCTDDKFPALEFESLGYQTAVFGQKSWNGVAIISKHPIENVLRGLPGGAGDEQSRYIEATVKGVRVASIYLPNGNPVDTEKYPYKLGWMDRLRDHAANLLMSHGPIVLGGDYNIIPEDRDCYDPALWRDDALFRLESRRKFRAICNLGYTEAFRALHPDSEEYTFWDYQAGAWPKNNGIRIDHFLLSAAAADRLKACAIDKTPRGEDNPSDHVPVTCEI
jgi:exodeoxyribonuclease-3